jgi:hypothetical protein
VRSVLWLYNEEQLRLRESLETESVVRQSSASKDVDTAAEEPTALEAVTRRQPLKIRQTEKT